MTYPSQTDLGLALIFAGVAGVVYGYVLYPLLLWILARCSAGVSAAPGYEPTVSFLITAHNEGATIAAKLRNTLALDYPAHKMEIVVVSDGSWDCTNDEVRHIAESEPRVRLLVLGENIGKTLAQNRGVRLCTGEVVVFSDATTTYDLQAIRYLVAPFRDAAVGGVSGRYRYRTGTSSPTGLGSAAFWNYENTIKKSQSRIRTLTNCSGCIYSVRRSLYEDLPEDACSDMVEPLMLVRRGYRVLFEERADAIEEPTRDFLEEFQMRTRVVSHGMRSLVMMRDLLSIRKFGWIAFQLISHKMARWMLPVYLFALLSGAMLAVDLGWARRILAAQFLFYAVGIASMVLRPRWAPLNIPRHVCTVSAAVIVSIFRLVRGHRVVRWLPVRHAPR